MPRDKVFFPLLNGATVDGTVALSLMHEFDPLEWGKGVDDLRILDFLFLSSRSSGIP